MPPPQRGRASMEEMKKEYFIPKTTTKFRSLYNKLSI